MSLGLIFEEEPRPSFDPDRMEIALEQGLCRLLVEPNSGTAAVVAPWFAPEDEVAKFFTLAQAQGYHKIIEHGNIQGYRIKDTTDCDYWVIVV
jgi:hypothetical protein